MKRKQVRTNIFYGWFIVAAGFIIMATAVGIVNNCASLFIKPISGDLGFPRSKINAIFTIRAMVRMVVSLFAGRIFSKFNVKKLMQVSTIVLFISYFLHSLAKSLMMFYLLTIIVNIAASLLTILPLSLIINNWFYEKRGVAIGIAFMGSGIGGMIFNSLVGRWIVSYGWQSSYQILSVILLLAIFPCTFFIIHLRPKDVGLEALGRTTYNSVTDTETESEGMMLSEALRTSKFWIIFTLTTTIALSIDTLMQTIAPHLTDVGYSITFSANIVALSMGSLAIGKLILGHSYDRLGIRLSNIISGIATISGLIGLIYAQYFISLILITVGVGLGCAFGTIANPIITQQIFGAKDYSSIYGVLSAANGLGAMIGPILNGYFFDKTGSYVTFLIISVIIGIISTSMHPFVFPKRIKT